MTNEPNKKELTMWNDPRNPKAAMISCFVLVIVLIGGGWLFYKTYRTTNPIGAQPQTTASSSDTPPVTANAPPPPEPKKDLEVIDTDWKQEDSTLYVVGTVINNSQRTYKYVQVGINLYDKEGNQTGSTLANVNNLEPGKKWKFKALVFDRKGVATFKVKDVTGL